MPTSIQNKLSNQFPREMCFQVQGIFSSYTIGVKFPEKFEKIINLGGDWGPCFKLKVDPNSLFEIQIKSDYAEKTITLHNEIKEIFLKSPFLISERKESSYQCEIPVSNDGVILHLSFDENFNINKAQMTKHWESDSSTLKTEILECVS